MTELSDRGGVWSLAAVALPDGRTLLASGHSSGQLGLWDPATGTPATKPLTGHRGPVWSLAAVGLPGGRTLLASGDDSGQVRLWLLTVSQARRTAPALQFANRTLSRQQRDVSGARKASGMRDLLAYPPVAEAPRMLPVPEVEATLVATLVGSRNGGWAALLPDGRSYKAAGDVSDVLWWAIKLCRFEVGELDRYDPTIRHLPHAQPIL
jgi:WD40 repeat protein